MPSKATLQGNTDPSQEISCQRTEHGPIMCPCCGTCVLAKEILELDSKFDNASSASRNCSQKSTTISINNRNRAAICSNEAFTLRRHSGKAEPSCLVEALFRLRCEAGTQRTLVSLSLSSFSSLCTSFLSRSASSMPCMPAMVLGMLTL